MRRRGDVDVCRQPRRDAVVELRRPGDLGTRASGPRRTGDLGDRTPRRRAGGRRLRRDRRDPGRPRHPDRLAEQRRVRGLVPTTGTIDPGRRVRARARAVRHLAADPRYRLRPRDDDRSRCPYEARGRDRRGTRQLHGPLPSTRGNCRRRAHAGSGWARSLRSRSPTCAMRLPTRATASRARTRPPAHRPSAPPTGFRRPARSTRSGACGPESCDEHGARLPPPAHARRRAARPRAHRGGVLVGRRRHEHRLRRRRHRRSRATARRSTWRCRRRRSRC